MLYFKDISLHIIHLSVAVVLVLTITITNKKYSNNMTCIQTLNVKLFMPSLTKPIKNFMTNSRFMLSLSLLFLLVYFGYHMIIFRTNGVKPQTEKCVKKFFLFFYGILFIKYFNNQTSCFIYLILLFFLVFF